MAVLLAAASLPTATFGTGETTEDVERPHPVVVCLDPAAKDYARVLGGPPATHSMRSGYVVLAPGKAVGKHSTEGYEEVVVVFEGHGRMVTTGGPELPLAPRTVAYCPSHTEHDVMNTGTEPLRYLYVVAAVPSTAKE
jgi:mannose-6-phosphate isomerase-like protein (cupin superfamily)